VETKPRRLESYIAPNDTVPFDEWLGGLRDRVARTAIDQRLNRMQRGLVGEFENIGDGLIELKIDSGPGYRVYCADDGESVLLLCGGTKRTQTADIARAKHYWKEYRS
jgi:putative addiction module killer protein